MYASGELHAKDSDRSRKLAFSTTALSFDMTSPAKPDDYRHDKRLISLETTDSELHLCPQRKPARTDFSLLRLS